MIQIHYISPYCLDRNFGDSINNAISRLSADENDWICLRDGDVAFLTPDYGRIIHDAVEKYGKEYSLIGCYTNRLGGVNQSPSHGFETYDIRDIYNDSVLFSNKYQSRVLPFSQDLAGMFMLFPFRTWNNVKFKNSIVFDREFTKGVRMAGGKVGIMPGLYVLHCYRLWAPTREEARKSVDHLIK